MSIHAAPYSTIVAPLARTGRVATSPWLVYWAGLSRAERLATIAIVTGGLVAIINSTAWACAVSYMERQKARAAQVHGATARLSSEDRADRAEQSNRATTRSAGN